MRRPMKTQSAAARTPRWRLNLLRRTGLVLGTAMALLLGLGAGAAYAYFTGTGSSNGSATVGTPQAVTVIAASGTVSSKLIPGANADLLVELNNPNNYSVTITGISQNGSVSASGGIGTCTNTGVTIPTQTGLSITVASGSNVQVHVPNGAAMDIATDSGCQGATFQIPVTVTVQR
jgi:hypothetical protein